MAGREAKKTEITKSRGKGADMRQKRTALGIGLLLLICGYLRFVAFPVREPDMGSQTLSESEA